MGATMEPLAYKTDDELYEELDKAAREFAGYTLHAKRPVEMQGDTTPRAWALRAEWAANAERRWLEIQAELDRRRDLPV